MRIYYNPNTITNPGTNLYFIHEVDRDDENTRIWQRLCKTYKSYTEALADDSFSGKIFFESEDVLYEAQRVCTNMHIAVSDYAIDPGINWDTYYAPTKEQLMAALTTRFGKEILNFSSCIKENPFDLYCIDVHYDGRCR